MSQFQNQTIRTSTSTETVGSLRVVGHWKVGDFEFVWEFGFRDSSLASRRSDALPRQVV